jgi:hypothetical protein
VTHREREFSPDDVVLLTDHMRQVNDLGPHGQPMSEATDPRADRNARGGWHYEANAKPRTDYAQLELARVQDAYLEEHGKNLSDAQKRSMQWRVYRVDD